MLVRRPDHCPPVASGMLNGEMALMLALVAETLKAEIADRTVHFDAAAVSRHRAAWVDRWMQEVRS